MKLCMGCMNEMEDHLTKCPHCGFDESTLRQESYYLDPGTIIGGKYIVGRVMSYGGHTVSYLGMDAEAERKVIVKEYLPSDFSTRSDGETEVTIYSGDAQEQFKRGLTNFLNEANKIQALGNPEGIARVYDCVAENDTGYVISEYVQGKTLKEILASGKKYSVNETVAFISKILNGLSKVHPMNIIHCDISPETIMVTDSGEIKLLDFGIAKIRESISMTQTGATMGTLMYMSPEQVRDSKHIGPESDVYSLAVSFVHMITGKKPYDSDTTSDYDIRKGIVEIPLDLTDVPADWQAFLRPYLEKDPAKRPALRPFEATAPSSSHGSRGFANRPEGNGDLQSLTDDEGTMVSNAPSPKSDPKETLSNGNSHSGLAPLSPTRKDKPKSKKGLWIGLGTVVVAAIVAILLLRQPNLTGSANGHEWVDLGLPSGTLWATCNIGASSPEDYGNYYAWGETSTKTTYNWDTYRYANGDYHKLTKYCNESDFGDNGFTDNLTTLQSGDDPATANWGSGWQTPSKSQWDELLQNTTNQWTTKNGVAGRLFTSKKNGQTLFLPAAGYRWDSELRYVGYYGYYWSSSLYTDYPNSAWYFNFDSDNYGMDSYDYRNYGHSVRPVRSARQN